MEIEEGELDTVEVHDEMGNVFRGIVVAIEDETSLNTAFTDFSDQKFYIHVRIQETHTDNYDYIVDNYPDELVIEEAHPRANKGPVVRVKWREVQRVIDY